MENKAVCIQPGELIVGERGPAPKATPTYREVCCHSLEDLEILDSREKVSFSVDERTRDLFRDRFIPFWRGRSLRDLRPDLAGDLVRVVERAMAAVESAFREIGVEVGLITTRLFALVPRSAGAGLPVLLIQVEGGFLAVLLLEGGDALPHLRGRELVTSATGTAHRCCEKQHSGS